LQCRAALQDELPVLLDQGASLAFNQHEVYMPMQFLARFGRMRLLADGFEYRQYMLKDARIITTAMAQHIKSRTEQFIEGYRF
jgi:hypothetical protein